MNMIPTDRQIDAYTKFQQDFEQICEETKDKIAITYYQKNGNITEISYSELRKAVDKCVKVYKTRGFLRGDRVAVIEPLCADAYIVLLTLAYMGVTAVVLDVNLPATETHRLLEDADVSAIITTEEINRNKITDTSISVFSADADCKILNDAEIKHPIDPDFEAIAILYSSGTTSKAKGVVIGYEQERVALDRLLKVVGTSDIRYLMLFPNSHVSGFTDAMVLLLRGGALATMEDASAVQLLKGFQAYKPNTFGMVPKVWETFKNKIEDGIRQNGESKAKSIFKLIEFCGRLREATGINLGKKLFHSINDEVFGGALENVHVGGGKSNPEVMRFFWNLGYNCFDFYASTEANIPILVTDGIKFMSSLGCVSSFDGIQIRIWNPDVNGIGEIQVKSDTMMRGYFRNNELTQAAFEDGYFKTGDYGKIVKGELYITGRIKESIYLKNGEKISPDDAEDMFQKYLPENLEFAIAGVSDGETFDQMCMFLVEKEGTYDQQIVDINKKLPVNYQCNRVKYVSSLPKTSVGKIKRFELTKLYSGSNQVEKAEVSGDKEAIGEDKLLYLIESYSQTSNIDVNSQLVFDLGMDSLTMFELCIAIEEALGVSIADFLYPGITVKEIQDIISNDIKGETKYNMMDFPVERTEETWKKYREFCEWTESTYDFSVDGIDYLNPDENYIFAPNHQSYCDGMWLMSKLPTSIQKKLCSFAADYLFEDDELRPGTVIMGGIPVSRTGNTVRTMKRVYDLLCNEKCSLLIHPEGTRTRNGELGVFKSGAAELSMKTGVKVVPVGICGAKEIFSADMERPLTDRDENGNKRKLRIHIGKPLSPDEFDNATTFTNTIRAHVVNLMTEHEFGGVFEALINQTQGLDIEPKSNLQLDLGIDSLGFFEIVCQIENCYGISISEGIDNVVTVQDLINHVIECQEKDKFCKTDIEKDMFQLKRNKWILWQLWFWVRLMKIIYRIEISGIENIPNEKVIICSNHINYFDPFWLLSGFSSRKIKDGEIICAVANERFSERKSMYYIKLLGGISVNRNGNSTFAMQRMISCLRGGNSLILFPEGARSRDGNMLPIKSGVAKIATLSKTCILPVRIEGGFEIWPRNRKNPRFFDWKHMRRYPLRIIYKPVLSVEGVNEPKIMKRLTKEISE